jgi:hypothetical protein
MFPLNLNIFALCVNFKRKGIRSYVEFLISKNFFDAHKF